MTAVKRRYRQYVTCWSCGDEKRHEGHGLCRGCHVRWDNAGRPDTGPPAPMPNTESGRLGALHLIEAKAERLEDFADLDEWGADYCEASKRLGVSPSTVFRYRKDLAAGPLQLRIPDLRRAS